MSISAGSHTVPSLVAFICGTFTAILGACIPLAWAAGLERLTSLNTHFVPMQHKSGFLFAILGSALALGVRWPAHRAIQRIVAFIALFGAVKWTKLSCHDFVDNQMRLQLFALAYNIGNFLRRLVLPAPVKHWTMTTMREKLIKIGAKVVRHSKYVLFQMAEVAVPQKLFAAILERIQRLRSVPAMAPS